MEKRESATPTAFRLICPTHNGRYLTTGEYLRQLNKPNSRWECPVCGDVSKFDNDTYEKALDLS